MTALRSTLETPAAVEAVRGHKVPTAAGSTPRVLGLDLSLTSTGVAGDGWANTIKPSAKLRGLDRMAYIRGALFDQYVPGVDLVVVEGPSYGSQAGQAGHHERAGLWWLVRYALWARGTAVAVVSPASLKLYATGKGNAGKDDMIREVARRFAWFTGDNNAADATWLAAIGFEHLGVPVVAMPAVNRKALAKCEWPDLDLSAVAA